MPDKAVFDPTLPSPASAGHGSYLGSLFPSSRFRSMHGSDEDAPAWFDAERGERLL
jgi:hypothetical protein